MILDTNGQPSPAAKSSRSSEDFRVTVEIARYRAMSIPSKESSYKPLIWWKKHKELFPILSTVARGLLRHQVWHLKDCSVCAVTCPLEEDQGLTQA
eukprot:922213-Amorphochlora_amoeboformis.AAC.1